MLEEEKLGKVAEKNYYSLLSEEYTLKSLEETFWIKNPFKDSNCIKYKKYRYRLDLIWDDGDMKDVWLNYTISVYKNKKPMCREYITLCGNGYDSDYNYNKRK